MGMTNSEILRTAEKDLAVKWNWKDEVKESKQIIIFGFMPCRRFFVFCQTLLHSLENIFRYERWYNVRHGYIAEFVFAQIAAVRKHTLNARSVYLAAPIRADFLPVKIANAKMQAENSNIIIEQNKLRRNSFQVVLYSYR